MELPIQGQWVTGTTAKQTHSGIGDKIGQFIVTAGLVFLADVFIVFVAYQLLGVDKSIDQTFFHGDPPFPIDATIVIVGMIVLPLALAALSIRGKTQNADPTLLAVNARFFGTLKACPDWPGYDQEDNVADIRSIRFHADAGIIRAYMETETGPATLTLELNGGRIRAKAIEPVSAALLYEAKQRSHNGSMDLFLDPRCSYANETLTVVQKE